MKKSPKIREYLLKHPKSTSSAVARRFNCSGSLVTNIKREMRIANELKEPAPSKSQMIRDHLNKSPGASTVELAKKYNCTTQLVSVIMRQMKEKGNLKTRKIPNDSKANKIRKHLKTSPYDSPLYISKLYECTPGLVYNIRSVMSHEERETVSDMVAPTPKVDKPKTTPLNKRVKVSRSLFWGLVKVTRYE